MDGSLPPPLLQNRACHFCGTRLLSDAPSVIGICPTVTGSRADLWSDVARLPLAGHRSLALPRGFSRFFRVTPSDHLHLTVLTSAYPGHDPRPWLLEESCPVRHAVGTCSGRLSERTYGVTPFPVSMMRIRRAVLSTGFIGSAHRSVWKAAGALSCAFWLQRVSLLRWFAFTVAQPHLRLRCP